MCCTASYIFVEQDCDIYYPMFQLPIFYTMLQIGSEPGEWESIFIEAGIFVTTAKLTKDSLLMLDHSHSVLKELGIKTKSKTVCHTVKLCDTRITKNNKLHSFEKQHFTQNHQSSCQCPNRQQKMAVLLADSRQARKVPHTESIEFTRVTTKDSSILSRVNNFNKGSYQNSTESRDRAEGHGKID